MTRRTVLPPTLQNPNTERSGEHLIFSPNATGSNFVVESGFIYYHNQSDQNWGSNEANVRKATKNGECFQEKDRYREGDQQPHHQNAASNNIGCEEPTSSDHLILEVTYVGRA